VTGERTWMNPSMYHIEQYRVGDNEFFLFFFFSVLSDFYYDFFRKKLYFISIFVSECKLLFPHAFPSQIFFSISILQGILNN